MPDESSGLRETPRRTRAPTVPGAVRRFIDEGRREDAGAVSDRKLVAIGRGHLGRG